MKEFHISSNDAGRRLDKYVMRILSEATSSFVYKMLRKKNIVLNDRKADGREILSDGDCIKIYLADETFDKFSKKESLADDLFSMMPAIVYEDDDIIIVNKPAGLLSQKSKADDISLNEICLSYVRNSKGGSNEDPTFTPSICNRLDRNTSGLVTFAKTYRAAKFLSEAFRDHDLGKFYRCIAKGNVIDADLEGYLIKKEKDNTVTISRSSGKGQYIRTKIKNVRSNGAISLVDITLLTGRTHQIRAHLASKGHPVIGDPKYGDKEMNDFFRNKYGIKYQMLVCYKLVMPDDILLEEIAGRTFEIDMPDDFKKVM